MPKHKKLNKIERMRRKHKIIDGISCNSDKKFRKKSAANEDAERLRIKYKKLSDKYYYIVRVKPDGKYWRVWWMYGRKDRWVVDKKNKTGWIYEKEYGGSKEHPY